jgi:DNA-binding NarL/FixJ family response regulator
MNPTTIVLADDHALVRQGIRALLGQIPEFSIVGEANDGLEALQLIARLQPDVLVVDVAMPNLGGLEVIRRASRQSPETRAIVLSMHANEGYVLEALRNGAAGYVLKGSQAGDLIEAVRSVVAGQHYLSPPLTGCVVEAYLEKAQGGSLDLYDTLTTREREVLHLSAEGHSSAEVAARLAISPRTAESHRGHMMQKLGLRTQTDLVRYALRRGIITMD